MSKPDKFPQTSSVDNTKEGQKARLAKLLKDKREKALIEIFVRFRPLEQERHSLEFFDSQEWNDFFIKFTEIIKALLALNIFEDDQEIKTECEEVLLLLNDKDFTQKYRYSDLINKIFNFFMKNKIFLPSKLPE